jgi:hypothetical protein
LVEKAKVKRPRGRNIPGWEDNIRIVLREIGCESVDWILLDQDRYQWQVVYSVMKLRVPRKSGIS